jgi:SNF2 family DNA or RNA helicase
LPTGPYLVVCPASVKRNWAREIEVALPGAEVHVVEGKNDDRPLLVRGVVAGDLPA